MTSWHAHPSLPARSAAIAGSWEWYTYDRQALELPSFQGRSYHSQQSLSKRLHLPDRLQRHLRQGSITSIDDPSSSLARLSALGSPPVKRLPTPVYDEQGAEKTGSLTLSRICRPPPQEAPQKRRIGLWKSRQMSLWADLLSRSLTWAPKADEQTAPSFWASSSGLRCCAAGSDSGRKACKTSNRK